MVPCSRTSRDSRSRRPRPRHGRAAAAVMRISFPSSRDRIPEDGAPDPLEVWRCRRTAKSTRRQVLRGHGDNPEVEFGRTGYHLHSKILNAVDFGAPQYRERLLIVGSRDNEPFTWPQATHAVPDTGSLFMAGGLLKPHTTVWETLFSKPNPYHEWPLDPAVAVLWVRNVVRPHAEAVTWPLTRPSPTVGAHQSRPEDGHCSLRRASSTTGTATMACQRAKAGRYSTSAGHLLVTGGRGLARTSDFPTILVCGGHPDGAGIPDRKRCSTALGEGGRRCDHRARSRAVRRQLTRNAASLRTASRHRLNPPTAGAQQHRDRPLPAHREPGRRPD